MSEPVAVAEDLDHAASVIEHPNSRAGADWQSLAALLRQAGALIRALMTPWRTSEEAAAHVRMSARTLEGYRSAGGGPVYHRTEGGKVLYHRRDLDLWVSKGRAAHTPEEKLSGQSK